MGWRFSYSFSFLFLFKLMFLSSSFSPFSFLTEKGYIHNTFPDDYLSSPPPSMPPVLTNQALLREIFKEEGEKEGKYGLELLVRDVVGEVYEVVDGLMEEMEFLLEGGGWEGDGGRGEGLRRDYEYLVKMKEMDREIEKRKKEGRGEKKKGLVISEVVPVAGLVMARLHVYNCEVNTVVGHWGEKKEGGEEGEEEGEEGKRLWGSQVWAGVWKAAHPVSSEEK